jgi:hypothetical protein
MSITLSEQTETRLRGEATLTGQDPDTLADALLNEELTRLRKSARKPLRV